MSSSRTKGEKRKENTETETVERDAFSDSRKRKVLKRITSNKMVNNKEKKIFIDTH